MFDDPDDKHWYCTSRYLRVPGHGSVNRSLDAVTEHRSLLLHLMGSMHHTTIRRAGIAVVVIIMA